MKDKYLIQIPLKNIKFLASSGENLFRQLVLNGLFQNDGSFCEGKRGCGKCVVLVNGKKELSCGISINENMIIELLETYNTKEENILKPIKNNITKETLAHIGELVLAVDIGTTTVQMAFCVVSNNDKETAENSSLNFGRTKEWQKHFPQNEDNANFFKGYVEKLSGVSLIEIVSFENPLVIYGRDVISKIQFAQEKEKSKRMQKMLLSSILKELEKFLKKTDVCEIGRMVVSGNVAMTTIFLGESTKSISEYPFLSDNLHPTNQRMSKFGFDLCVNDKELEVSVEEFESCQFQGNKDIEVSFFPAVSAFAGGDLVSGLSILPLPGNSKYSVFLDIGTNTEVAVFSDTEIFVSSTPAGPCFEGGNISCGMSATEGAIYDFEIDTTGLPRSRFINKSGNASPKGICGTGLISIIAEMRRTGILEDNGDLKNGERYMLTDKIYLSQKDIREFQLAKSAIRTAISVLEEKLGIIDKEIDKVFIGGGFSTNLSSYKLVLSGILPKKYIERCVVLGNTSLLGNIQSLKKGMAVPSDILSKSQNIQLALVDGFQDKFLLNINFD